MRTQLVLWLTLGALVLAACSTPTPVPTTAPTQPPPTETPAATATEAVIVPTATAPPENTATPSATPTIPPTPDPNEGVGDVIYRDNLDGTGNWFWTFEDEAASFGVSREQKQLNTVAKQSNTWRFTIGPDTTKVGDQQIRVSAHTNTCADADEYALLFRGNSNADFTEFNFYAFKLRCNGQARLERLQGPNTSVIVDWTASPAINSGANADNTLIVWAHQDQMRFYVNDQYLFSAQDAALTQGFYGFYLQDRTNGTMSVSWKSLEVRSITLP